MDYGDFSENGNEFVIKNPDIPRNWYNYLYNDRYITFFSQVGAGEGFLQDERGRRQKLVCDRAVFIRGAGEDFSAIALPVEEKREHYSCTHGIGYSEIKLEKSGVSGSLSVFVPNELDGEAYSLVLSNKSGEEKRLTVQFYIDSAVDAVYTKQGYTCTECHFDKENNAVLFEKTLTWNGKKQKPSAFFTCNEQVLSYDCAKNAFIGAYGTLQNPKSKNCTNSDCINEKMCFCLQNEVDLQPFEQKRLLYFCGIAEKRSEIAQIKEQIFGNFDGELDDVKKKYAELFKSVKIKTPDEKLNKLLSPWLQYLTNMGSRWARVRHNGFRDIVSDTECLASFAPRLAWERFKRILAFQYKNGYAPRTFLDGVIKDNNFADCAVWLTFTAKTIIFELGDVSLLSEKVPFCDGDEASVFEHLRRANEFLFGFQGLYGLTKIWGGDWNDNLNGAGMRGKGVSVWLSMALYRSLRQFCELAEAYGESSEKYEIMAKTLAERIEKFGWDEKAGYYIYGYDDDGGKICAADCEEGRIHLNPQVWAVLSGVSENGKKAMESAEKLLRFPVGCSVLHPPYTRYYENIGELTTKPAGTLENGGVYLHAVAWKIAADAMLSRRDLVSLDLDSMLPHKNPVVAGRAEPYTMCNSYCARESGYRYGTPGQSWRTASGQWLYKAVCEYIFGLKPTLSGLLIEPCFPSEWKSAEITKTFRKTTYHIIYRETGKKEVRVNGKKLDGNILPSSENGIFEVEVDY